MDLRFTAHIIKPTQSGSYLIQNIGGSPNREHLIDLLATFVDTNNQAALLAHWSHNTVANIECFGILTPLAEDLSGDQIALLPTLLWKNMEPTWAMLPHVFNSNPHDDQAWQRLNRSDLSVPLRFVSSGAQ